VKALSIRQPWAMSIVQGSKRTENRGWNTHYRGEFLIHASKGLTRDELEGWAHMIMAEDIRWPGLRDRNWHERDFERGGIVGIARVDSVVTSADQLPADQQRWFFGPYGFVLADVRAIPFVPCKGALDFFTIPDDVEAIVRSRLAA
jgi:hypothetical protein